MANRGRNNGLDGHADPLDVHRERLLAARVEAQEMQNAVVAGQLISRQAVELAVGDIVARARMILLALPGKVGAELAEALGVEPEAAIPILRREVLATLQVLAKKEADEAGRVSRAVQAGIERGTNGGDDGGAGGSAEDDGGGQAPRGRSVAEHDPGEARGRGGPGGAGAGLGGSALWAALVARGAAHAAGRPGQPVRRRGHSVGSTR